MIACEGYTQSPFRTGYEQIMAHRTSDLYATTAKQEGVVVSLTDKAIKVQYADGTIKGIQLGRRFGNAAGLTTPHSLVSPMKAGQAFKEGDIIAYNTGFFEPDFLNPKQVVWKTGAMVKVALLESADTFEDSTSISPRISSLLKTKMTKVKQIVLNFNQDVMNMVNVNDEVHPDTPLCYIAEHLAGSDAQYNEETMDTLKMLSRNAPMAKEEGIVERIEIYYNGDIEDMSPSLAKLVTVSDRELKILHRGLGKSDMTGRVDEGYRVEGAPLFLDTLVIKVYITAEIACSTGDKAVFCNQMKTTVGRVHETPITTEDGQDIDAVFGAKSCFDRIVSSPFLIGSTNVLLGIISRNAAAMRK